MQTRGRGDFCNLIQDIQESYFLIILTKDINITCISILLLWKGYHLSLQIFSLQTTIIYLWSFHYIVPCSLLHVSGHSFFHSLPFHRSITLEELIKQNKIQKHVTYFCFAFMTEKTEKQHGSNILHASWITCLHFHLLFYNQDLNNLYRNCNRSRKNIKAM